MPDITPARFSAAYNLSKQVRAGEITEAQAVDRLVSEHGMGFGSAYGYVRQLDLFLNGKMYTRTINDPATRHYLERIAQDFGPAGLQSALTALRGHIAYYEAKASKRPGLRAILAEFETVPSTQEALSGSEFEAEVQKSLRLSQQERCGLLPPKGSKPLATLVTTKVHVRNPHVVAAARLRAAGVCERCQQPAPFTRKSDGTPFLEVHHPHKLADGGDDTLENAEALCPNCHRQAHYG
jgi:5-methylcytosine-specific restriction protein A